MKIIRSLSPPPGDKPLALTIGNFDGMHIGHQSLLQKLSETSGCARAVMSFEPHPLTVLKPKKNFHRLYDFREKCRQCEKFGIDFLYLIRFNKALSELSDNEFNHILFDKMQVKHLLVGENFRYGAGGRGDFNALQAAAQAVGATVQAPPLMSCGGQGVSSGRGRAALADADFAQAAQLLGRQWSVSGRVIAGDGRGRQWGYPTANLRLNFNLPCRGIFAAYAFVGGQRHRAAVSIGSNPTLNTGGGLRVEAFLLDFDSDIYRRRLRLELRHKLREEKAFASTQALIDGIAGEVKMTEQLLSNDENIHC